MGQTAVRKPDVLPRSEEGHKAETLVHFTLKFARLITVQFSRKTKIRVIKKQKSPLNYAHSCFCSFIHVSSMCVKI